MIPVSQEAPPLVQLLESPLPLKVAFFPSLGALRKIKVLFRPCRLLYYLRSTPAFGREVRPPRRLIVLHVYFPLFFPFEGRNRSLSWGFNACLFPHFLTNFETFSLRSRAGDSAVLPLFRQIGFLLQYIFLPPFILQCRPTAASFLVCD